MNKDQKNTAVIFPNPSYDGWRFDVHGHRSGTNYPTPEAAEIPARERYDVGTVVRSEVDPASCKKSAAA